MTQSYVHIRLRRDTANNWSTNNPILKVGEPGLETDTRKLKFGDGVTPWNNLEYSGVDLNDTVVLENIDDRVAGLIKAGSNISISYNDNANELTISAVGLQLAGDYATLVNGRVPASQLPSYVDDVIEVANSATLPSAGETGKIYVTLDNNKTYRWSGSTYVEISASPGSTDAVPEGSVNKYYTDARASAAATDATTKANNAQAFAVQRSNHTGIQAISTVDGLQTALDNKASINHTHDEHIDNRVAQLLKEGTNVSIQYNDEANTLVISAASVPTDPLIINQQVNTLLRAGSYIDLNYNDLDALTIAVTGVQPSGSYAQAVHAHVIGDVTNLSVELSGKAPLSHAHDIEDINLLQSALDSKQPSGDYATLVDGKIEVGQLPGFVQDIEEYSSFNNFPPNGSTAKLYLALDTAKIYRWSGSIYIEIVGAPGSTDAVPEGSVNLYYTNARAASAAPVQSVSGKTGVVVVTKNDIGLGNVDNTSDLDKPINTATSSALALKANVNHTHTASDITDFNDTVKANLSTEIVAGSGLNISYATNPNRIILTTDNFQPADNYATLIDGKVPAAQLPSYVDEIQEYASSGNFPMIGSQNVIYRDSTSGSLYRWSGTTYISMSTTIEGTTDNVLEGSTNLYFTNQRASSAAPVQSVSGKVGSVTLNKNDVGLTNVDNTSDASKPVSAAQQTALDLKANINNPTFTGTVSGITKSMVGLTNVDNTSDANKPVSAAQQAALDLKANINSPIFTGTVSGITKSMVGLGNVDNTSDLNKPISTATQAALDLKSNVGHTHTSAELLSWLSEPGTRNIYVDNGRTDTYTADGSQYRPFKTMRSALASVSSASSLSDMNDTTKRFYCFRIAPGFYDEESGGTLNIPFRPVVVFDVTGGATLKGNYLWSRPANVIPATSGGNTNNVTSATTTGSNSITVSTSHVNYSRLKVGTIMTGTGMPTNTVITAINGSTVTLNNNATATNASASLGFDSGELNNFVFAMIGSNHRPMFNNGQHSFVGIQGNLTVHTVDNLGFNQVHLTNCGVRGVIEATSTSSGGSTMHLYAYQNATFDTLKATGTHGITLYAVDCQNSTNGNGFGNIIGNVAFNTLEQVFFHSYASIFSTGRHGVFNMDATFMPAYNEIKATSFTRTNNVATVTLSLNHGQSRNILPDGYWREQYVLINGATEDTSFNTATSGAKVVDFPTATTVSYENTGPDVSVAVTAANAKWIKGTFFGNSNAAGYIQPNPVSLSLNEGAIHTHPGWNTNTQPGLGSAFLTARSSAVTFRYPAIGWAANSQYVRNRILLPGNGYQYRNVTATGIGRSGATAPTFPTTIGSTVVDGAITWQCEQLSFPLAFNLGFTGSITSGSNQVTVTSVGSVLAANFQVGYVITGTGIPANTTITAISGATLTISANATATNANVTLTVAGTSAISYNVQHALEVLHDSRNIYHNQIDSGIAGAATVQQAFKSLKANVDLKANINSPTFTGTVSGITKSMVGLGNVDNTSDLAKPISTAVQTALDGKATVVSVPASATATGTAGQIAYDTSFLYICVAANTWRRVAISTW